MHDLRIYKTTTGKEPFSDWLESLDRTIMDPKKQTAFKVMFCAKTVDLKEGLARQQKATDSYL